MQEVQGWKQHCIEGTENRAAERAVEALRALGGTNVERYCGPHKVTPLHSPLGKHRIVPAHMGSCILVPLRCERLSHIALEKSCP